MLVGANNKDTRQVYYSTYGKGKEINKTYWRDYVSYRNTAILPAGSSCLVWGVPCYSNTGQSPITYLTVNGVPVTHTDPVWAEFYGSWMEWDGQTTASKVNLVPMEPNVISLTPIDQEVGGLQGSFFDASYDSGTGLLTLATLGFDKQTTIINGSDGKEYRFSLPVPELKIKTCNPTTGLVVNEVTKNPFGTNNFGDLPHTSLVSLSVSHDFVVLTMRVREVTFSNPPVPGSERAFTAVYKRTGSDWFLTDVTAGGLGSFTDVQFCHVSGTATSAYITYKVVADPNIRVTSFNGSSWSSATSSSWTHGSTAIVRTYEDRIAVAENGSITLYQRQPNKTISAVQTISQYEYVKQGVAADTLVVEGDNLTYSASEGGDAYVTRFNWTSGNSATFVEMKKLPTCVYCDAWDLLLQVYACCYHDSYWIISSRNNGSTYERFVHWYYGEGREV